MHTCNRETHSCLCSALFVSSIHKDMNCDMMVTSFESVLTHSLKSKVSFNEVVCQIEELVILPSISSIRLSIYLSSRSISLLPCCWHLQMWSPQSWTDRPCRSPKSRLERFGGPHPQTRGQFGLRRLLLSRKGMTQIQISIHIRSPTQNQINLWMNINQITKKNQVNKQTFSNTKPQIRSVGRTPTITTPQYKHTYHIGDEGRCDFLVVQVVPVDVGEERMLLDYRWLLLCAYVCVCVCMWVCVRGRVCACACVRGRARVYIVRHT